VERGAVQVDGLALEFNIDPAETEEDFIGNTQHVMRQLMAMIPNHQLSLSSTADFSREYLNTLPQETLQLGCSTDYSAWSGEANVPPNAQVDFRTAAGHVHVGWTAGMDICAPSHFSSCCHIVKQLDFFLGLPSLLYDADVRRRSLYGAAGCFRPKPFGVEYRVLSNQWLFKRERMSWVYRATQDAMLRLREGDYLPDQFGDIQSIINTSRVSGARNIIKQAKLEVPNA
jgi:hypothetical protein